MMSTSLEHCSSGSSVQPLPRLGSASSLIVEKEYKSGATYKGQVKGSKRAGKGTFTWPNGAVYKGEFVENLRHGSGENFLSSNQRTISHVKSA